VGLKSAGMSLEGRREADFRLSRSWVAILRLVGGFDDVQMLLG
jgi:hypothetical protein